ncbi:MAG: FKBP-type peptidyl-prolyl cis-trans isomerase [Cytophagales bacterium]|jgi:FKBP-type peptidyl-prolyl cis-trans isomerase|nr:FKBP-type peptidyl-prolyl cis-trans isomerase [Cytophagales bacterium]MCA6386930.1 FKBP-type peptidyl-prolyl cis-trans isomerase [Cytophagales bacterium]MCA6395243.1 FKBP-type peptidyl-prolyl cis-trans isomerase [Cytophagales bacterium]MCA6398451.1 FKBP-type peptidyl-prolyl cis-trans isomerase [Cytophagales bacterium]MCA6403149.1 FKBP-type peptidyl-prolyl cis-trans isomerase [Cytophagales bacterium]
MKNLALTSILIVVNSIAFGQSKKELQSQVNQLKVESQNLKKEMESLKNPVLQLTDKHTKASYGLGVLVASNIKAQGGDSLSLDVIVAAIKDVFNNKTLLMQQQECSSIVQQYMQEASKLKSMKAREEGQRFLLENKTKPGVTTTASGLQYQVLTVGKGKAPTTNDQVTVHYTGKLLDGTEFDSSVSRGSPSTFGVTQVIAGWTEALQLMREGDKWVLFIPENLAYGDRGAGSQIPPYATLVFEIELIKIN